MRDHKQSASSTAVDIASDHSAESVGRSTLAQQDQGEGAPQYTQRSLFASPASASEPAPPGEVQARAAAAPPAPKPGEHQASMPSQSDAVEVTADDPNATETIYGDQHKDAHKAPFEHHHAHAEKHHPKTDKFNQGDIHSDKIGHDVAARPGVTVKRGNHRDGVFMLKNATAIRYTYTRHGNDNVAEPYDIVHKDKLANHNYKNEHKDADKAGNTQRLLLNAAMPRTLMIKGEAKPCVLSWIDGMTAAWIAVDDLAGDKAEHAKITAAAKHFAQDYDPAHVKDKHGHALDANELKQHSKHYVIRNDAVGQADRKDEGTKTDKHGVDHKHPRVLAAGAKGGDNVEHYLNKDIRKPGFNADGDPLGANVTRSVVSLCMNLPEPHAPPLAVDTAQAGQSFFAMKGHEYTREAPVFENGKHHASILQRWVFGHLAMHDANGNLVPDPSRRGWLPLRVLAEAAHLETHEIAQRIPNKGDGGGP